MVIAKKVHRCAIGNKGFIKAISRIKPTRHQPKTHPVNMSQETNKPEAISDEQLEDVAGGTMDNTITTENCSATLSTINL
ncbi:MAG TPA: hypothetical protein VE641_06000 [Chthoniobacterales bacterium]|jgi:hypothetical protein|nr:hypothetical protein [Chthoniobacterales bacterium]